MLRTLFRPATSLMSQMSYAWKFLLMGALAAVVIAVLFIGQYRTLEETVDAAQLKLTGVAAIEPITRLTQAIQQHRGLSAGIINGNDGMRDKRAAKEREIGEAIAVVAAKLPSTLYSGEVWKTIQTDWEQVRADGLTWTAGENFSRHTRLIDHLLIFEVAVADALSITFDPDIDSYYLIDTSINKYPIILERLGQLRAKGSGILSKKLITEQQKIELSSLITEMNGSLKFLRISLDKTAQYNPALKQTMNAAASEIGSDSAKLVNLISSDIIAGTFTTAPKDYFDLSTTVIDKGYKQIYDTLLPTLRSLQEVRVERTRQAFISTMAFSAVLLLVIGYFSVGTYLVTIDNVGILAREAHRIACGDLTVRIDLGTRDEHRLVADSFNEVAESFANLARNVQHGAHQVLETSQRITESSTQIADSSSQQSESAASMAASVEEMSTGVENISQNARDAHGVTTEAGSLSAHGGEIVGTVVTGIEKIADAVNHSAGIIENLGQHSDRISTIVGTIKEIADQTNLLALNAAIEAARAGESGRGFAVVADEVRKLAERTANATQEISGMIVSIQSGTQDAVSSMKEGVDRVAEGVQLARQAGDAMQRIQNGARQAVAMVSDISSALHEQSATGTQIARNVEIIARMAEENSGAVAGNAATTEHLEQLAAMLESEVRPYKIA